MLHEGGKIECKDGIDCLLEVKFRMAYHRIYTNAAAYVVCVVLRWPWMKVFFILVWLLWGGIFVFTNFGYVFYKLWI